jgi:hypothetical protein
LLLLLPLQAIEFGQYEEAFEIYKKLACTNACCCCCCHHLQAIEFGQYEEAFEIYKKFGKKVEAVQVLLTHCKDLDRAHDYANKVRNQL